MNEIKPNVVAAGDLAMEDGLEIKRALLIQMPTEESLLEAIKTQTIGAFEVFRAPDEERPNEEG